MIRRTLMLRGYPPEAGLERFGADCGPSASFLGISYLFIFPHLPPRKTNGPAGPTHHLGKGSPGAGGVGAGLFETGQQAGPALPSDVETGHGRRKAGRLLQTVPQDRSRGQGAHAGVAGPGLVGKPWTRYR